MTETIDNVSDTGEKRRFSGRQETLVGTSFQVKSRLKIVGQSGLHKEITKLVSEIKKNSRSCG